MWGICLRAQSPIEQPMGDILFDEKIDAAFTLPPAPATKRADNGNQSAIHWDLCAYKLRYGGGEYISTAN